MRRITGIGLGLAVLFALAPCIAAQAGVVCNNFSNSEAYTYEEGTFCAGTGAGCQDCANTDTGYGWSRDIGWGEGDTFALEMIGTTCISEFICFILF